MNGLALTETEQETDVGVLISRDLKPSRQCNMAAARAGAVLSQIYRSFHFRDKHTFVRLYVRYVRPHLEFCTPAWNPCGLQDKNVLEKIQMRAVNMISGLRGVTYKEKLQEIGLDSLEMRRLKADLLQTFKIVHKFDDVNHRLWFRLAGENIRVNTRQAADSSKLKSNMTRLDIRKHFYSNRIVQAWNQLPSEIRNSGSIKEFRKKLNSYKLDAAQLQLAGKCLTLPQCYNSSPGNFSSSNK